MWVLQTSQINKGYYMDLSALSPMKIIEYY